MPVKFAPYLFKIRVNTYFCDNCYYMVKKIIGISLPLLCLLAACGDADKNSNQEEVKTPQPQQSAIPAPAPINYTVVNVYPHDTRAFTQGLVHYNNKLYEGTGLKGESTLRIVDYKTGTVQKKIDMEQSLFGEGITILKDTLYQLTYQEHLILIYTAKDLKLIRKAYWPSEGWGLTHNGTSLIVSDGSDKLYFLRPSDFKLEKVLNVNNNAGPVYKINELEYINGFVYANQWETDNILKIDPATGFVVGIMDFKDILKKVANINYDVQEREEGSVLNGIALDETTGNLFITGKRWPKLLEIKLN